MTVIRTEWLRENGYNGPRAYWTPCISLTAEQREEWNRLRDGRVVYYVDGKGRPKPA